MLGDKIGEVKGKIMGERILDVEGPKIEYSFSANGRMKGVDITHLAKFWTIPRGNGVLYGEGQGVMTTTNGSGEIATEIVRGIGQLTVILSSASINSRIEKLHNGIGHCG